MDRHMILKSSSWIKNISDKLLEMICKNIDEILDVQLKDKKFERIEFEDEKSPELKKKLVTQAIKNFNCTYCYYLVAGFISGKELFIYACR